MFVKICGITNPIDAELAIAAGADALGFNFWPRSRRYIEPSKVAEWLRELPVTFVRVAVLVNPTLGYARQIAGIEGIDLLQLHGAESPEFCLSLAKAQVSVWKAIPMTGRNFPLAEFHTKRLLLDTAAGPKFGGTGRPFQWSWARELILPNPPPGFISPGGVHPEK